MCGRTYRVRQKSRSDFWTSRRSRGGPERSGGRAVVPGREQSHPLRHLCRQCLIRLRHWLLRALRLLPWYTAVIHRPPTQGSAHTSKQGIKGAKALVLMLRQVLGCSCAKRVNMPCAENHGLAKFGYPLREISFGLSKVAPSSAFANACSSEQFVDVPETTAFDEPWRSLVSHSFPLLG
jgi:hypothetical protein